MPRYALAKDIKVRDEEFGLLFYLCRSTSLIFINSRQLLTAKALKTGGTAEEMAQNSGHQDSEKIEALMEKLTERGLVDAQG